MGEIVTRLWNDGWRTIRLALTAIALATACHAPLTDSIF